ncbi:hypothetical protein AB1Y20_023633 [Prymnesium parvum]|uniref:Uridine kinase n=1 Tax=Prymnesium parvum TaxID=97485 RepID=A0AB34JGT8_PRYPA
MWRQRLARAAALAASTTAAGLGIAHVLHAVLHADEHPSESTDATLLSFKRSAPQRTGTEAHWDQLLHDVDRPVVVGIAGGTGSGKTTVACAIAQRIGAESLVHISHDSYYRPLNHLPMQVRARTNFDHPDALETSLLVEHLRQLKSGAPVSIPMYDFATHSRCPSTTVVHPARIILVEGILIYANEELRDMLDIKIFVDTDSDVRFIRRLKRDISERGREVGAVIGQYLDTVRPMHNQFVEPSKRYADVIIPTGLNSVALEMVIARLQHLCAGPAKSGR